VRLKIGRLGLVVDDQKKKITVHHQLCLFRFAERVVLCFEDILNVAKISGDSLCDFWPSLTRKMKNTRPAG
jgi:hypothetical protein